MFFNFYSFDKNHFVFLFIKTLVMCELCC